MRLRRNELNTFLAMQVIVVGAFALSYGRMSVDSAVRLREAVIGEAVYPVVGLTREEPLRIEPLYDDPDVVSDEELAMALWKIRPKFEKKHRRPNHVEHALRAWGQDATFPDPEVMSGTEMRDLLLNHEVYAASWEDEGGPLLSDRPLCIDVRWGSDRSISIHHDHCLACLSEAGVSLNQAVVSPFRRDATFAYLLQEAVRDLQQDERETEWSAQTLALWLPPVKRWRNYNGRVLSFDLLAKRLVRSHKRIGVCLGLHRVYSLMVMLRVDDEYDILSDPVSQQAYAFLENVRDLISASQHEDGRWPSNWHEGADALKKPSGDPAHYDAIATGHLLEWLSIAPKELHPPREDIVRAAKWAIKDISQREQEQIRLYYTFYSHVGNTLAFWRKTTPSEFWQRWRETHAFEHDEEWLAPIEARYMDTPSEPSKKTDPAPSPSARPATEDQDTTTDDQKAAVPANEEIALEGFCPVSIVDAQKWARGKAIQEVKYDGKTYRLAGTNEKATFESNAEKYAPVLRGDCVVCYLEKGERVGGSLRSAATHQGRLYLFASPEDKQKFLNDPAAYVDADLAIDGDCPVCRKDLDRSVTGKQEIATTYRGLRYRFASNEFREKFLADPAAYAMASDGAEPNLTNTPATDELGAGMSNQSQEAS